MDNDSGQSRLSIFHEDRHLREALHAVMCAEPPIEDTLFNDLALRLFRYQFSRNDAYRQFCRDIRPETLTCWEEIPPLPVTAFKYVDITCKPFYEAALIFHSSGTTHPSIESEQKEAGDARVSRHAVFDLEMTNAAIRHNFKRSVCPDRASMRLFILTPSPKEAPHSSLSYMMDLLREAYGTEESDYYIHQGRLLGEKLAYDLSQVQEPVILLGTSFSFVHFIDFHQETSFAIQLPPGSRLMDTGGFKGRSRTVSSHWLYGMVEHRLGIPPSYCINEYGMSELTSQFYDGVAGRNAPRVYTAPPQTRWRILDPETLRPVNKGETGLLAIYDLANIDSALALLTEDMGRAIETGFEFMGRARTASIKGCSLTLDTLLASP